MKKGKENRKISVRLNNEAYEKVINAVNGGINKRKYINNAIIGRNTDNIDGLRVAIMCICNIQAELELIADITAKNNIRKELNKLCHALR